MNVLRTPDAAFENLADFPYAPHYFEWQPHGLRMHYIDEGPRDAPIALLMHGMPTWSYLNRHIIRELLKAGYRCIAPDHIGFGRSDKVGEDDWYSIARHTEALKALITTLDLKGITLFCQDWGGPISLAQVATMPERFDRLVIMNTWLHHEGYEYTQSLRLWNAGWKPNGFFARSIPDPVSMGTFMMRALNFIPPADLMALVQKGQMPSFTAAQNEIRRAYDAPFIEGGEAVLAGPRRFPLSLPFDNPEGGNAREQEKHYATLLKWTKPIHFIWGAMDDIFTLEWGKQWASHFSQATFDSFPDAGHFLQDTHGAEIARIFLAHRAKG
ncbi:MAG: alpha/beta fold hydrolase [Rhizobiales bacterium]|nr:alpha/beta fold hydrolase [Hyphomicrobiales bacterium]